MGFAPTTALHICFKSQVTGNPQIWSDERTGTKYFSLEPQALLLKIRKIYILDEVYKSSLLIVCIGFEFSP